MLNTEQVKTSVTSNDFPGRWIGGVALILGPLLLMVGVALRYKFNFFFPDQLVAFKEHPTIIIASYSAFAAGNILLLPAVILLSKMISIKRPGWAFWGATFAIFGLLTRTFHAGIDHLAFQLVRQQNVDIATKVIANSYGAFHIFKTFNLAIMIGWIVLAIGSYRSGVLKIYQCVALALMSTLPLGVLKGSTTFSFIATAGLCVALLPLGFKVLTEGPKPKLKTLFIWIILTFLLIGFFYFFGQAG
ncbi:hypothetical protein PAEVO_16350 [Paenibacillus sp. GM2FR]|uniref:fatty acid desaturase family protein n=1 Tax=Paenibacillus TaxID=44249 RepID=UPI000CC1F28A|nr:MULTISPECIES: fatty acid desaturase family protein [Paenibacillus]MEC0258616.1 fatty acid desaturase family protein [Paenibacillus lautus]PJN54914.1 hypothetical protein PAEVO_16350 [Paenibacillus sp. GM2FR]